MQTRHRHWFPAKRYGWGWGLPIAWQGWVIVAVFFVLLAAGASSLLPRQPLAFVACASLLSLALTGVCWLKGERPRWRWGA